MKQHISILSSSLRLDCIPGNNYSLNVEMHANRSHNIALAMSGVPALYSLDSQFLTCQTVPLDI